MNEPTRAPRPRRRTDPEVRFLRHVDKDGPVPAHCPEMGPCWLWTGALSGGRYGMFATGGREGRQVGAHCWSYEHFRKPIPEGYEVDHLCHPDDGSCEPATCMHRRCVNPAHLAAVTGIENNRRSTSVCARNARKTHCPQGHEYTPENTRVKTLPNGGKGRDCKECARQRNRTGEYNPHPKPEGWMAPLAAANAAKTHCPQGHEYTPENTIIDKSVGGKNGGRRCKTCRRERAKTPEARAKTAAHQRAYQERKRRVA